MRIGQLDEADGQHHVQAGGQRCQEGIGHPLCQCELCRGEGGPWIQQRRDWLGFLYLGLCHPAQHNPVHGLLVEWHHHQAAGLNLPFELEGKMIIEYPCHEGDVHGDLDVFWHFLVFTIMV